MLTQQRHQLITEELERTGRVVSGELAQRYDLSEDTIRRDLRHLAAAGLCRRVYGGAVAPSAGPLIDRHAHLSAEKKKLALEAVKFLRRGQVIMVDAGSTNTAIIRAIPAHLNLTIVTNAIDIAAIVAVRDDLRLIVLGGDFVANAGACTGPETLAAIAHLHADVLLLGSCGVDPVAGVTAFEAGEAAVKRAMVAVSELVVVAATAEKLGTTAPYRVVETSGIGALVAMKGAGAAFGAAGVTVRDA